LRRMSKLIESGQASLLVVSADEARDVVEARLAGASATALASTHGDLAQKYLMGVEESGAQG
jgi:hypothetical protein